jgi:hypothetical protein
LAEPAKVAFLDLLKRRPPDLTGAAAVKWIAGEIVKMGESA